MMARMPQGSNTFAGSYASTRNPLHLPVKALREIVFIASVAVLPALTFNIHERSRPDSTKIVQAAPNDALWIDARSEADFAREHVPGAMNLNETNWEDALMRLFEVWQPPRPIVVYCSNGCPAGAKIAAKLLNLGIEPVQVFEGGFEKWKQSKE